MSEIYQALYRKWRPQTFNDVIAQPYIVGTLTNQLLTNKTAHAYLFTGSRGTGKTTCARILAKAVVCENPNGANPCLKCSNCIDFDNGAHTDIIEIDAASNNGVDDIRDLRDAAIYMPQRSKFKVFIIDETHMLSTPAFNALLKTLEEPPSHIKFILATTEVHKVPITILSRCQRFDFQRITPTDIAKRLQYIANQEKISVEDNAYLMIASLADGGMRDAISLLDRCSSFADTITVDVVTDAAGISGRAELFEIMRAVLAKDTAKAFSVTEKLYNSSKDITRLCEELILQFRNIMLLQIDNTFLPTGILPDEVDHIRGFAMKIAITETLRILHILQKTSDNIRRVINKRVEMEMCLVEICTGNIQSFPQAIPKAMPSVQPISQPQNPVSQVTEQTTDTKEQVFTPTQTIASPTKVVVGEQVEGWYQILEIYSKSDPGGNAWLVNSYAAYQSYNSEIIIAVFVTLPAAVEYFKLEVRKQKLKDSIAKILGQTYKILIKIHQQSSRNPAKELINRAENAGIITAME